MKFKCLQSCGVYHCQNSLKNFLQFEAGGGSVMSIIGKHSGNLIMTVVGSVHSLGNEFQL